MSDFAKSFMLAVAAPLAAAVGEMAVDELNARRAKRDAESKASRARWETLITEARAERVRPPA